MGHCFCNFSKIKIGCFQRELYFDNNKNDSNNINNKNDTVDFQIIVPRGRAPKTKIFFDLFFLFFSANFKVL